MIDTPSIFCHTALEPVIKTRVEPGTDNLR